MGLITWGYGHLTIITMGLGRSIRIIREQRSRQYGEVEFQDTTPTVRASDKPITTSFESEKVNVEVSKESQDVSFVE